MRDSIDTLRVIYWYEGVKGRAGCNTPYALERMVEPDAFRHNSYGDPYHKNKWSSYQRGERTPRKSQVERAETLFPGTQKALHHALWKSLDINACQDDEWVDDIIGRLVPDLQVLLDEEGIRSDRHLTHKNPGRRLCTKLQRRASLDTLACATALTRRAIRLGDMENAYQIGGTAFNILLSLGRHFRDRKISKQLFGLYVDRVLAGLCSKGKRYYFERYDFDCSAVMLDALARNVEGVRGMVLPEADEMIYKSKILRGDYGFDSHSALRPIEGPVAALSDASEDEIKDFELDVRLQAWGWENVIRGDKDRFPPSELFLSSDGGGNE